MSAAAPPRVAIVTDSTADLPPERARRLGIVVVPLTVLIDGVSYADGELDQAEFFRRAAQAPDIPTTSQPSAAQFQAVYDGITAETILSIHISSKLSGTYASALAAAAQLHQRDIRVYDSGTVSMSLGCIVQDAAEAAGQGASAAEVARKISVDTLGTGFYALLDTLHFAQRSGRINMAQALLAGMLQIKPVISIRAGVVAAVDRRRTLRKGLERLVELATRDAPFRHLAVLHAGNPVLAGELAAQLRPLHDEVEVLPAGTVIGTHCGPGAVAACYLRR